MNRLTFKEPNGTFGIVGMNEQNQEEKMYAVACKLLAYEETELPPDVCKDYKIFEDELISKGITFKKLLEYVEKMQVKKATFIEGTEGERGNWLIYKCNTCNNKFYAKTNKTKLCTNCGQKLDE